mgnify:FL=1
MLLPLMVDDKSTKKLLQERVNHILDNYYVDKLSFTKIKPLFQDTLWDIPEAVNQGFNSYLDSLFAKVDRFSKYHKKNKKECSSKCFICKMEVKKNERKKPRIC